MRIYFKYLIYFIVFQCVFSANAGSFDDFFSAVRQNNPGPMEQLLRRGFDVNTRDERGEPPLVLAIRDGQDRIIATLLAWPKTDVNLRNSADESPLMMAAIKGRAELAATLIERGADVNKTGWTPLHYAASAGHLRIMRLLLENSAYIDAESPNGTTPLMMAARYGSSDAVKLLLDEGADPTLRNQRNLSAMDFAHTVDRTDVMRMISAAQTAWVRLRGPKGSW